MTPTRAQRHAAARLAAARAADRAHPTYHTLCALEQAEKAWQRAHTHR